MADQRDFYEVHLADARVELERLKASSEEFGRRPSGGGPWEDLRPIEIALLEAQITEFQALIAAFPT